MGFRYSALREAERLRLKGFVRNSSNGDVEVWAEGTSEKLALFQKWLKKGPALCRVDSVNIEETNPRSYVGFTVEP